MVNELAAWPGMTVIIGISIFALLGDWEWKLLFGGNNADEQEEQYPRGIRRDIVKKAELFDSQVDNKG